MPIPDVLTAITPEYDPTIAHLARSAPDRWGRPEENRKLLVPYGYRHLDLALMGINSLGTGSVDLIMGEEKSGKSRFVYNVLLNYMLGDLPKDKPVTLLDSLESGGPPTYVTDVLICMLATRRLMDTGHTADQHCPKCDKPTCEAMRLDPDFLRYFNRTKDQAVAIEWAIETLAGFPLLIYGPNHAQGDTRDITKALGGNTQLARWYVLQREFGVSIAISDHLQQYKIKDHQEGTPDYERQLVAIQHVGDFVAESNIHTFLISQVSLTSIREAQQGVGKLTSTGGRKGAQEAFNILTVWKSDRDEMGVRILDSRKAAPMAFYSKIEVVSGTTYGDSYRKNQTGITYD